MNQWDKGCVSRLPGTAQSTATKPYQARGCHLEQVAHVRDMAKDLKTILGSRVTRSGFKSQICFLDSVLEHERRRVGSGDLAGDGRIK